MRTGFPTVGRGQKIGLFGGSFDPAHLGHVQVTKAALARFGLDRVWWLVTPGNPLKPVGPASMEQRLQAARDLMQHPHVAITDIEVQIGTQYTAQTLDTLMQIYPQVRFTWLMGADNLAQFHRWKNWRMIMDSVPVGVVARPGDRIAARLSRTARIYRTARLTGRRSAVLGQASAPAWSFINIPMSDASSTQIRRRGEWV